MAAVTRRRLPYGRTRYPCAIAQRRPCSTLRTLNFDIDGAGSCDHGETRKRQQRLRGETTVYVLGFMSSEHDTTAWLHAHGQLIGPQGHYWQRSAAVFDWQTAGWEAAAPLRFAPVPALTAARVGLLALRGGGLRSAALLSPLGAALCVGDLALHAGRIAWQYRATALQATHESARLAAELRKLRYEHGYLRVVAHSLGGKLVGHACALLEPDERPDEVHWCAPAVPVDEARSLLSSLTRSRTWRAHAELLLSSQQRAAWAPGAHVYYSKDDLALGVAFRIVEQQAALGYAGPVLHLPQGDARQHHAGQAEIQWHEGAKGRFDAHGSYPAQFARLVYGENNVLVRAKTATSLWYSVSDEVRERVIAVLSKAMQSSRSR